MDKGLGKDEKLLWQGQPTPGIRFSPQDFFITPLILLWLTVVGATTFHSVFGSEKNDQPVFMAIPFLFIGFYLLIGRFIVDAYSRKSTRYRLTTERAIIESGIFQKKVRSVYLSATAEISLIQRKNGSGTVVFGSDNGRFSALPRSWPGANKYQAPGFDVIEDSKRIYDLAIKAQRDCKVK